MPVRNSMYNIRTVNNSVIPNGAFRPPILTKKTFPAVLRNIYKLKINEDKQPAILKYFPGSFLIDDISSVMGAKLTGIKILRAAKFILYPPLRPISSARILLKDCLYFLCA